MSWLYCCLSLKECSGDLPIQMYKRNNICPDLLFPWESLNNYGPLLCGQIHKNRDSFNSPNSSCLCVSEGASVSMSDWISKCMHVYWCVCVVGVKMNDCRCVFDTDQMGDKTSDVSFADFSFFMMTRGQSCEDAHLTASLSTTLSQLYKPSQDSLGKKKKKKSIVSFGSSNTKVLWTCVLLQEFRQLLPKIKCLDLF